MKEQYEQALKFLLGEMEKLEQKPTENYIGMETKTSGMKKIADAMESIGRILIALDSTEQAQKMVDSLKEQLKNSF